ncbi:1-(5-phosphoribosyl)-5-[(5-phosphoribosylamino)methylideneamino]imidazole-4-carboxamide isomerase [soil metagenome]
MELIAAIDMIGGRSVRLVEGDYGRTVVGALQPAEFASRCAAAGIPRLHVVDLDGARAGEPRQLAELAQVVAKVRESAPAIQVQAAGGLRSSDAVAAVFDAGADAAVLGTAALERPGFLAACANRWPGRVMAALDLRDGRAMVDGWRRALGAPPLDIAQRLLGEGAAALLVTDTRRDGTLAGPNAGLLVSFRAALPDARLVAAGGIRSIEDLLELRQAGLDGAIVGMALLNGRLAATAALTALRLSSAPAAVTMSRQPADQR